MEEEENDAAGCDFAASVDRSTTRKKIALFKKKLLFFNKMRKLSNIIFFFEPESLFIYLFFNQMVN